MADLAGLGARIWRARRDGALLTRADFADVKTRADAYAVQKAAVAAAGLTRAGWKIAATNPLAQERIGVTAPGLGAVFADHVHASPATLQARTTHAAGLECEVAFVIDRDLSDADSNDPAAVLAKTRHAQICVEMVSCRVEGGAMGAGEAVMLSDFSFNGALITGAVIDDWRDLSLADVAAETWIDGEKKAEGKGAAVMGGPLNALYWAAAEAAGIGDPLRAGDIVSTGTMTGITPVAPGQSASCKFGPLGSIEITFTD